MSISTQSLNPQRKQGAAIHLKPETAAHLLKQAPMTWVIGLCILLSGCGNTQTTGISKPEPSTPSPIATPSQAPQPIQAVPQAEQTERPQQETEPAPGSAEAEAKMYREQIDLLRALAQEDSDKSRQNLALGGAADLKRAEDFEKQATIHTRNADCLETKRQSSAPFFLAKSSCENSSY